MTIYDRISLELKRQNKTRKDLSKGTNISYNTLTSLFQRKSGSMKMGTAQLIANYLNVTMDWLLLGDEGIQQTSDSMESALIKIFKKLTLKGKTKLMVYAYDLEQADSAKKNE